MKYVMWSLGAVMALIGVVLVIGWLLPVEHVASRSASFNASPETVYALISDPAQYPTWRGGVTQVEILSSAEGKLRFREHSSDGPIVMEIEEAKPPTCMVTRIADPDQPFGGTWTFEVAPAGTGSTVTITERGEVYNPIFRFMSRFVFGHMAGIEAYLEALKAKLGE